MTSSVLAKRTPGEDETWGATGEDVWTLSSAEPHPIFVCVDRPSYIASEYRIARAQLAAAAPEMARAGLLMVEIGERLLEHYVGNGPIPGERETKDAVVAMLGALQKGGVPT